MEGILGKHRIQNHFGYTLLSITLLNILMICLALSRNQEDYIVEARNSIPNILISQLSLNYFSNKNLVKL